MRIGQLVLVRNGDKYEIGIISDKSIKRSKTVYDVILERGVLIPFISTNLEDKIHINRELSRKVIPNLQTPSNLSLSNFSEMLGFLAES